MQRRWWLLLLPVLWLLLLSCCLTSVTANSEGRSALPYPHPHPLPPLLSFSLLFFPSPHHELFDLSLLLQFYSRNPAPCGARILWRTPRDTVAALVEALHSQVSQSVSQSVWSVGTGTWDFENTLSWSSCVTGSFFMAAARSEFTEQTGFVSPWWQMVCQDCKLERYEEWL
jgi:hypothetical protein